MKNFVFTAAALSAPFSLMAQDNGDSLSTQTDLTRMFVMLAIGIVFFYFILWRPEQKRRNLVEQQRSALKKGDKVNAMGIIGTVTKVNENTIILRMVDGAKIEMLKAAVNEIIATGEVVSDTDGGE